MARKRPRPSPRKEFPKRRDRAEGEARPNPHALAAEAERAAADLPALEPLDEHSLLDLLDALDEAPFLLVLDQVQDPHNLGACLRSADAAGVHAIIVPKDRSAPLSHTVRMIATGAAETVPVARVTNLARTLADLKERNVWIVGTAEDAPQALWDVDLKGPIALVLGSEGSGLRRLTREACDFMASLPMAGRVGSLNVSVAAGVCLFEALRQRRADPGAD